MKLVLADMWIYALFIGELKASLLYTTFIILT